jgi:hypothetical protein
MLRARVTDLVVNSAEAKFSVRKSLACHFGEFTQLNEGISQLRILFAFWETIPTHALDLHVLMGPSKAVAGW